MLNFPSPLETRRMNLNVISEKYAIDIFRELNSDITKYMTTPISKDIDWTRRWIKDVLEKFERHQEIVVVWTDKISGQFIWVFWLKDIDTLTPEIGLWTKQQNSLRGGLGLEWITEFLNWIQKNLSFQYITCYIERNNVASNKLLSRVGGILELDDDWNEITKRWKNSRGEDLVFIKYRIPKQ